MIFTFQNILATIGIACLITGMILFNWYGVLKNNNKLLAESNKVLEDQNKIIKEAAAALQISYDCLKTQVDLLRAEIEGMKGIPLVDIRNALVTLVASNATTMDINSKILHRLTTDAHTLTRDTAKLVEASKKVASELKEHDERKGE